MQEFLDNFLPPSKKRMILGRQEKGLKDPFFHSSKFTLKTALNPRITGFWDDAEGRKL
jgi:hypothetical protein